MKVRANRFALRLALGGHSTHEDSGPENSDNSDSDGTTDSTASIPAATPVDSPRDKHREVKIGGVKALGLKRTPGAKC